MLRAIWVDTEDEHIISEALTSYLDNCEYHKQYNFFCGKDNPCEFPSDYDLLRIRTLANRIKRAKEVHEKSL